MRLTFGIFKSTYRGYGIYWSSKYNVEGDGQYDSMSAAKLAIDARIERNTEKDRQTAEGKIASGSIRGIKDVTNSTMTLVFPNGNTEIMTLRQFRQQVFEIEEKWATEVVIA